MPSRVCHSGLSELAAIAAVSLRKEPARFMRNSRVLGLLAVIAVIAALAFPPLWSVLRPDAHVRPSDAVGTPPQRVNPAPATGTLPAKARPTQAELTEILRNHGYMNSSNPVAQP